MWSKRQYNLLSERYFECLLGDFNSLMWMIGQAPLIAWVIIIRWKGIQATETLHFVLCLSCVWFGCVNACREFAKEKIIYQREKLWGLEVLPYFLSKIKILSLVGLVEIGLFYFILDKKLDLNLNRALGFIALFCLYETGMSLGLMLSRWCGNVQKAVLSVPIAIIPQIVFSKFVLPVENLQGVGEKIEKMMIVKWGFEGLRSSISNQIEWGDYFINICILLLLFLLFGLLTFVHFIAVTEEP